MEVKILDSGLAVEILDDNGYGSHLHICSCRKGFCFVMCTLTYILR